MKKNHNNKNYCTACMLSGYCPLFRAYRISDEEMNSPDFVRDVRLFAYILGLLPSAWKDYLAEEYMAFPGVIVDKKTGRHVDLDMDVFEIDDDIHFEGSSESISTKGKNITDWFGRVCCTPCPDDVTRIRKESRERFKVFATILRARNPGAAVFWGMKGKAANDNNPSN